MFYINAGDRKLYKMNSGTERIKWSATLAEITETAAEKKVYSRLFIRCELEKDAYLTVEINMDNAGWEHARTVSADRLRLISIPVFPRRCDSFQIRLSGEGGSKVYAVIREMHLGSEV